MIECIKKLSIVFVRDTECLAWIIQCAVERSHSSVGESPTRQRSFQSVAVGTVSRMFTEQLPDVKGSLQGFSE